MQAEFFNQAAFSRIKVISKGVHSKFSEGCSIMEAIALVSGEAWTDRPRSVCPVISSFLRTWGESLPDQERTKLLLTVIGSVTGTKSTAGIEAQRAETAFNWLKTVYLKAWLTLADVPKGKTLDETKRLAEKRWDEVSMLYRTASGQMVTERGMSALTRTGMTAAILAAKAGGWDPGRDQELLHIQAICACCAKIVAKLTAKEAAAILGTNIKADASVVWAEFNMFVTNLQKDARKLVRLMAKMQ